MGERHYPKGRKKRPRGKHDCVKESGVQFDPNDPRLTADNIRELYPRKTCPKCGGICYASFHHYIYGDW